MTNDLDVSPYSNSLYRNALSPGTKIEQELLVFKTSF